MLLFCLAPKQLLTAPPISKPSYKRTQFEPKHRKCTISAVGKGGKVPRDCGFFLGCGGTRTEAVRTPNDPEQIPNGLRTDPEQLIPNGPRTDPEQTTNGVQTDHFSWACLWELPLRCSSQNQTATNLLSKLRSECKRLSQVIVTDHGRKLSIGRKTGQLSLWP